MFVGPDDPEAHSYWISGDPTEHASRVWLHVQRVAGPKGIIRSDWLKEDPECNQMQVLTLRTGTNFPVSATEAERLEALWAMTGETWSYAECVAALKVYAETKGQSISRLPDSPVAQLALQIGRAVGGAYNKLMNYRAIDPTDEREGLSGAASEDKRVWDIFFDTATQTIRLDLLEAEYARLWTNEKSNADAAAIAVNLERRAEELLQRPLAELEAQWKKRSKKGKPRRVSASTMAFERDPLVVALAKLRAEFRCEVPGCTWPGFLRAGGNAFIEVHHIQPLGDGGADTPENAAAVCPSHHRELHHGAQAEVLRALLTQIRSDGKQCRFQWLNSTP